MGVLNEKPEESEVLNVQANPEVADKMIEIAKKLFRKKMINVCLDDPGAGLRQMTCGVALFNSWVRPGNNHAMLAAEDPPSPPNKTSKANGK